VDVVVNTPKALRYGTRSPRISQFYLHNPRSSANARSGYSFTNLGGGRLSWPLWLVTYRTEISVWQRDFNQDMVAHPNTNRARRK